MARGRKTKPVALKLIQGNPGKRRIEKALPDPKPAESVECPNYVAKDAYAKRRWNELAPELVRLGLLTNLDIGSLSLHCLAFAEARRALDDVRENSREYETQGRNGTMIRTRPAFGRLNESMRLASSIGANFGLTPVDRIKLEGIAQGELFGDGRKGQSA